MRKGAFLGIDCGTSGVRAVVIDAAGAVLFETAKTMPASRRGDDGSITQDPADWATAVDQVIARLPEPAAIAAVAIDGTSGTILAVDADGVPLSAGHMYNDPSAGERADAIRAAAPRESAAHGATSPLARLLALQQRCPTAAHILHQADWLAGRLTGRWGVSDDNNALKSGWDPVSRTWPDWMDGLGVRREWLPEVLQPGAVIGPVRGGPLQGAKVCAGTTDGCASFLATGAETAGDGVTALGSTLTIKLLLAAPVFAPEFGIYSHRIGDRWLAGGASNSGGDALKRFIAVDKMAALADRIDARRPTGRHWHPLPGRGERFPVNDPQMEFAPSDLPDDEVTLFQALLEGVAAVEKHAYDRLQEMGGTSLRTVRTVGSGAANAAWTAIRQRTIGVAFEPALSTEAAYGTARLAADLC